MAVFFIFQAILSIVKKELAAVWQDKKSRMVLIVPPLIQLIVFSFAAVHEVNSVSMAIYSQAGYPPEVRSLVSAFQSSDTFDKLVLVNSYSALQQQVETESVMAALIIPSDYPKNILNPNQSALLQLILDGRKSNSTQLVNRYVEEIVKNHSPPTGLKKHHALVQKPQVLVKHMYNENLEDLWFNVPNILGLVITVITLLVTSLTISREREMGTFDQLLVSPLSSLEILLGKMLPGMLISMAEAALFVFITIFLFRVPFEGSFFLLFLSVFSFIFSLVGVGLFISALSQTQQQAILGVFVFLVPAVLLSGFVTPIENMPEWLQILTYLVPLRYFVELSQGLFLKDIPWEVVWVNLWPMITIAIVNLSLAGWYFRSQKA